MLKCALVLLTLLSFALGCSGSSERLTDSQRTAIRCAENWRKQGFTFDPNSMTCAQMFEKAQDARRARYWVKQGYRFDPNVMTSKEMDQKVRDVKRAEYWKQERGYTFDANSLTAEEMDHKAEELQKTAFWKEKGYYYDPNSQKVYLDKAMRTELGSLAGLHENYQGGMYSTPVLSDDRISRDLPQSGSGPYEATSENNVYLGTGGGHWVRKKMDHGQFILLEDRSLWRINPINKVDSRLWLPQEQIVITESENPRYPYRLVNADASDVVEARFIVKGSTHWISESIDSGKFLKLQDDSLWEVSSLNTLDSALWLTSSQMVVLQSQNPLYPYLLINVDDGQAVEAKLLAQ